MALIQIEHNPTRGQLAVFGAAWILFFAVVGAIVYFRIGSPQIAGGLWIAAVVVPTLGAIVPGFMRLVFLGASYAAFPIGFVLSYVLFTFVYYALLSPIALAMRLFGYDPLRRRFDREADTYWTPREQSDSIKRYFKQF